MNGRRVCLTSRDRTIVHAAWSLGWITSDALTALVAPGTSRKTLAGRLAELAIAGYLRRRRIAAGPGAHLWLYGAGPRASAIDPAYADAWRPPDSQLAHTAAVASTLAALVAPGRLGRLRITAWQGEAELRCWHQPGAPLPDLLLHWTNGTDEGAWAVEVDRGTESRGLWRRKLVRYLHARRMQVLVVTTSDERARNIARLAHDQGAPALTTHLAALQSGQPPMVYDAIRGRRRPMEG